MSDELTFNPSDIDVAPDEPVLFQMGCDSIIINKTNSVINSFRINWVSDELTFNPSDIDVVPDEPISLQMGCDSIIIN